MGKQGAGAIPPAAIAAAVAAAREFLRSGSGAEQTTFERLAASAILLGEAYTGTLLLSRAVEDVVLAVPGWRALAAHPVNAIAGVTALPADGAPSVLAADGYRVDIDGEGRGWVRVLAADGAERVAVAYTAGLAASWDDLPAPIAQGVVALIAHLADDRGAAAQPPAAVAALWRPYRRMRLATDVRA